MSAISLVRYSPYHNDNTLTAQLVECFRDVFAERPWNEWLKCQKCGQYWGKKDSVLLAKLKFQHCELPLIDFWPRDSIISDLYHEITKETSCWLALHEETVIGFCWGYSIVAQDLEAKLGVSFGGKLDSLLGDSRSVAYQDEVGVISTFRDQKIAKLMITKRLDDFLEQGLQIGIVRTRQYPEPSKTFLWYTEKLGYEILYSYPDPDGRVILSRSHEGLKNLLTG
jgi:hypothetical protein